jgi:glycosyltransferase involved in cell wall biosynthesis
MRVLVVHNRYQQRGGEDAVAEDETALLRAAGHAVDTVLVSNDAIAGFADKVRAALDIADGRLMRDVVAEAVRRFRPDVVHVHNFFPLLSPAVHARVRALGPATVQTLHNFRMTCAGATLLRDGAPCELCVGRSPLPGIVHRCYRGSLTGSAALAHMIAAHRRQGTWRRDVDRFIVLSRFAHDIFVRAGVPAERIVVKPNAVDDAAPADGGARAGVLFVGRLSEEKGVRVLLDAARLTCAPITVIGDGPLASALRGSAPDNVRFSGGLTRAAARAAMAWARVLVMPSIWYEGFPVTVAEAFAAGTPVIASRIGALAEIVEDGRTGWLVEPGNVTDLAAAIDRAVADPHDSARRGAAARETYLVRYTARTALASLEAIYAEAIASRRATGAAGAHEATPFSLRETRETAGLP